MARILNTRKAVAALEDLMRDANEKLILVSPYLRLSKDFKELLSHRNNKDKVTIVIFGKQELKPEEMRFLESLRFVVLKYHEDLHAKCYVNDKQMIITSLNLYEFSMANNKELGVLIDRDEEHDQSLYDEAWREIEFIDSNSVRFEFTAANQKTEEKPETKAVEEKIPASKEVAQEKDYSKSKYYSVSAMAKEVGIQPKTLFAIFENAGLMKNNGGGWIITKAGLKGGGQMKNSQYGEYVAWPEEFIPELKKRLKAK